MTYTKFHDDWVDGEAGGTPITEAALDHIESGLYGESVRGDTQDGRLDAVEAALVDVGTVESDEISDSTSVGRAVLTAADAAAARAAVLPAPSAGKVLYSADGTDWAAVELTTLVEAALGALIVTDLPGSPTDGMVRIQVVDDGS